MDLKNTQVAYVRLQSKPGATLNKALFEATKYSFNNEVTVKLVHNYNIYTIDTIGILSIVEDTKEELHP